jgi:uncharacterized protein involved in type VI secretion and phage assembly
MSVIDLPSLFFQQIRNAEEEAGKVFEAVVGVVTDNKDPDKQSRVKVKFPTLSADDNSWWATVVSMGAGANRGMFFTPEVDDEVLVIFEHGDMTRPVVVGSLWGGKDKPPGSNSDGGNKKRIIKSRGGTTIEFDDDQGKITIKDGGGAGEIVIDKANKISLTAKTGDVCIHGKDDLTIVANEVNMQAKAKFDIKATSNVKGGSDGAVNIKGTGMVKVQGAKVGINNGGASAPSAPSASPAEVPDPIS